MPSPFKKDCLYSIVAKHSRKALDIPGPRKLERDIPVQQWDWVGPGAETQRFLLLPADDSGQTHAIASWASGMFLGIEKASQQPEAPLLQGPWFDSPHHMFLFEPVPGEDDTYWIRARHSGLLLDVYSSSMDNGAHVVQYHVFPGNQVHGDNQKFIVQPVRLPAAGSQEPAPLQFDADVLARLGALLQAPFDSPSVPLPRLTDPQKPSQGRAWQPVGRPALLPYSLVADNNLQWQVRRSPYYTLTREVCYVLQEEYFTYNNTSSDQEYEVVVTAGFSAEESSSFSRSTSLQTSTEETHNVGGKLEGEVEAKVSTLKLKAKVEAHYDFTRATTQATSLDLGYSSASALSRNTESTVRRLVKCPAHTSLAVWTRTSRFTLSRLDGSVLRTWEVPEGGVFIDECAITE